jgi:hypothetical protein
VEQISGMQDHIDIVLLRKAHDFIEGLPAVVLAICIALVEADMAVSGDKDPDSVCTCLNIRVRSLSGGWWAYRAVVRVLVRA